MKRLFNTKYYSYNEEGNKVTIEAERLLKPLAKKYLKEGYDMIDLEHCLSSAVDMIFLVERLDYGGRAASQKIGEEK